MNRTRINQILGVLLFPYLDPELDQRDFLLERYQAYEEYLLIKGNRISDLDQKQQKSRKYQQTTENLITYLADRSKAGIKSYDDLLMLCELYYPVGENYGKEISRVYLDKIEEIAVSLLTYRDGVPAIRTWNNAVDNGKEDIFFSRYVFDKVQIWNMLCCYMVPDIFIAAFAVICGWDETVLYGQKPYISLADKLFVKSLKKGIAENHLHFNAGFDYESIWLNTMNPYSCYQQREHMAENEWKNLCRASAFRLTAALYLSTEVFLEQGFASWMERTGLDGFAAGDMDRDFAESMMKELGLFENERTMKEGTDYLLETVYPHYIELKTSSEFILLFQCYRYARHQDDLAFSGMFLQYLRIKNDFFQNIQQSSLVPGLRHFQKYFRASKDAESRTVGKSGMAMDVFRAQAKMTSLKKLEIRIAPDVDFTKLHSGDTGYERSDREIISRSLCRQLEHVFSLYRKYLLECIVGIEEADRLTLREEGYISDAGFSYHGLRQKICEGHREKVDTLAVPSMGIVYHLIKMENLDNISGYYCAKMVDGTRMNGSGHRLFLREAMGTITEVIEKIRSEIPFLNEYIVGIDAASDENAMEPWMFAPAYNRMRSRSATRPVVGGEPGGSECYYMVQNVGFTYHVGEDYRHIVSGLRHIDEVIEEFHYKPGDRLGHAIALGTDIGKWVEENEAVALPIAEYLDNLLWIWGKSVYDGVKLPVQLEVLEMKILENAGKIYGNADGLTVLMLYGAYKGKFRTNHKKIIEDLNHSKAKMDAGNRCGYCRYHEADCTPCLGLWSEERLIYTNYCPVFVERGSKVCLIPIMESEKELYKVLQEYLLRKVEQKGIYVETNPTSNVTIGDFDDLLEHPIFRMNSLDSSDPMGHHVMVTVNSDDPSVFNTNVENELAYIYYAVEHGGYAKEDALNWIDKIRQNGLDASFVQEVKNSYALLEEVSSILDSLRSYQLHIGR